MMRMPSCPRVSGPLGPYAQGFWKELARQGYSGGTAEGHVYLMAYLSRWLVARGLDPDDLTVERLRGFLADRRANGQRRWVSFRSVDPLLGYLRGLGVVPEPSRVVVEGPFEEVLQEFGEYLLDERRLAASTAGEYDYFARLLLSTRSWVGGREAVGSLSAEEIGAFMVAQRAVRGTGSLNNMASGLRALMRFLYVRGYVATSLVAAVPTGPSWRGTGLPRAVEPAVVARLLAACDRRTVIGRRDFAVLTVLWRLGLRSAELAALDVDDVDWRAGEIVVWSKGGRRERLPLPHDVGEAIAGYCRRGRHRGECRSLFLRARAPYGRLSRRTVGSVVTRACDHAGVARIGPHALRHTAACQMRAAGAPLLEIGQALRHRQAASTAWYARDDREALIPLARCWPGGAW